jgi:hypothetical protein
VRVKTLTHQHRLDEAESLARAALEILSQTDAVVMQADAAAALADVLGLAGRQDEADEVRATAQGLYRRKGDIASATALATA